MSKRLQKILVTVSVLILVAFFGCAAFQEAVTPAYIEPDAIKYADVNVPTFTPWTSLWDAKYKVDRWMDLRHKEVQLDLVRKIEDDDLRYTFLKDVEATHIRSAEELRQNLFSPEGPLGLLIPTILGGTLGALLIPRPGDRKRIAELEKVNGKNNNV